MEPALLLIVERDQLISRVVYSRAIEPDYAEELTSLCGGEPVEWSEWLMDLYRAGLLSMGLPDAGEIAPVAKAWALGDNVFALLARPHSHH